MLVVSTCTLLLQQLKLFMTFLFPRVSRKAFLLGSYIGTVVSGIYCTSQLQVWGWGMVAVRFGAAGGCRFIRQPWPDQGTP
jgi:hypothetical protein